MIAGLIADRSVVVCCGSGGVGKTTMAATIGLAAAMQGRRVVVITVDPARRLGDALGLEDGLGADPAQVALPDDVSGELWAMMLDPAVELERVIRSTAVRPGQADEALANPFTQSIATSLGGTQEYMATEAVYRLISDESFDLVVVDTPPSDKAMAVVEAPDVLVRFLDHQVFKLLMGTGGRAARLLSAATQPLLKAVGRVIGSNVLNDVVEFLRSFTGMETSFRQRAIEVQKMWRDSSTAFVLVATPTYESLSEISRFNDDLQSAGISATSLIANGVTMLADVETDRDDLPAAAQEWLTWQADRAASERSVLETNSEHLPAVTVVGRLPHDVHDVAGLRVLADQLSTGSTH